MSAPRVVSVVPDSPAALAGLVPGDEIVALNGEAPRDIIRYQLLTDEPDLAIVVDRGAAATPLSNGAAYWGGAYCTTFWIDRSQQLVAVLMTQVRPYNQLNIQRDFQNLVYQAVIE